MALNPSALLYGFYAAMFLTVFLLAHGVWQLHYARRGWRMARRRRLGGEKAPAAAPEAPDILRRAHRGTGPRATAEQRLPRLLSQAGYVVAPRRLLLVVAGLSALLALAVAGLLLLSGLVSAPVWAIATLALAVGLFGGLGVPVAYLRYRRRRRLARFAAQLPDALEVLVRSLRAGHPVASAMVMVATDLPQPIAGEFAEAVDEMTYGLDLRQALGHLASRVDVEDLRFIVASVNLQHETGGNLAEVLQRLADLIRARSLLTRKVQAHTAEARLSARVLAVMPIVFVALIMAANPAIYGEAARDPLFLPILLGAGALQVFGILAMRRMAALRV